MAQGVLPFKYETEKNTTGMTALAGLPVYLDLARGMGLSKSIEKHLKIRKGGQGWTDSQIVLWLIFGVLSLGFQKNRERFQSGISNNSFKRFFKIFYAPADPGGPAVGTVGGLIALIELV